MADGLSADELGDRILNAGQNGFPFACVHCGAGLNDSHEGEHFPGCTAPPPPSILFEAVALALTYGTPDSPAGNLVPDIVWQKLHSENKLGLAGDETGELWDTITQTGIERLHQILTEGHR
jgi:hypothetical protein